MKMRDVSKSLLIAGACAIALAGLVRAQQPGTGQVNPTGRPIVGLLDHQYVGGAAPAITSCGTGPLFAGSDLAGIITTGLTGTACTITFAAAWNAVPICTLTGRAVLASYSVTRTALMITATNAQATHDYLCIGQPGG